MQNGNDGAGELKVKVAGDEDLGDGPGEIGVIVRAQQALHLLRKGSQADSEGEEDRGAKPHRRIQNAHESQEPNHGATVRNGAMNAKPGMVTGDR